MKNFRLLFLATLALLFPLLSGFALEPTAQAEVDYLLGYMENPAVAFYAPARNTARRKAPHICG